MMPSYRDGWTTANPYMLFSPFDGAKMDEVTE